MSVRMKYDALVIFILMVMCCCIYALMREKNNLEEQRPPNIIVIIADDLGSRDVGYQGANDVLTPNIDALAYNGVIFQRHYTLPTCTPSRTAFLTGRHPIRMGLQGIPLTAGEPRGIPLDNILLPSHLKNLGYKTHLVGKWHVGYQTNNHVPTSRGFDTFYGYYNGYIQYFNHTITAENHTGYDFHRDEKDCLKVEYSSEYLTDLITEQATKIISQHDKSNPFYLQIAHLAVHHSGDDENPLEVRDEQQLNKTFGYIQDTQRRRFASVMSAMDESVGQVIHALKQSDMLENSVILFFSDNGGQTIGPLLPNYASNYPLRGVKFTMYEGGIRNAAYMYSPLIKNPSRVSNQMIHLVDWLPTFYALAGGKIEDLGDIDGMNQWPAIVSSKDGPRDSFLVNIEETLNKSSAVMGKYKLIKGHVGDLDGYYGDVYLNSTYPNYNVTGILTSTAAIAIESTRTHNSLTEQKVLQLREQSTIHCRLRNTTNYPNCTMNSCLFDITEDPCETTDISYHHPEVLQKLESFIQNYTKVLVNQTNTDVDPAAFPENFHGVWMPWINISTVQECNLVLK